MIYLELAQKSNVDEEISGYIPVVVVKEFQGRKASFKSGLRPPTKLGPMARSRESCESKVPPLVYIQLDPPNSSRTDETG